MSKCMKHWLYCVYVCGKGIRKDIKNILKNSAFKNRPTVGFPSKHRCPGSIKLLFHGDAITYLILIHFNIVHYAVLYPRHIKQQKYYSR